MSPAVSFAHSPREALDQNRADVLDKPFARLGPIECSKRLFPGLPQLHNAGFQDVIGLVTTVLYKLVEPPQPFICLLGLACQGRRQVKATRYTPRYAACTFSLASNWRPLPSRTMAPVSST